MKAIVFLSLLAGVLSMPMLGQYSPEHTKPEDCSSLFRIGDYAHALTCFSRAEKEDPGSAVLHNAVGITLSKLGKADKAEAEYLEAIRLDSTFEGPRINLGVSYLTSRKFQLAEKQLKDASVISPKDPFVHYYLATLYLATARDKDALAEFMPAKSLIEQDPGLMIQFAKADLEQGDPAQAEELIQTLEQTSSVGVQDEYELAVLFGQKHLYPIMLSLLRKVSAAAPASWEAKFDVAIALLYTGQFSDAAKILDELASERPKDADVLSLLGTAYEQSGQTAKALDADQRALKVDPNDPDRYLNYTRLLMELDRYEEAGTVVEAGIIHTPQAYALRMRAGAIKFSEGEFGPAREIFEDVIRSNPKISLAYYGLAQTYLHEGNEKKASDILKAALVSTGPDAKLEYLLGLISEHAPDPTESITAFLKAIELDPDAPDSHYELGKVFLESGNLTRARSELEKTIALQPQYASAFFQLSKVYRKLDLDQQANDAASHAKELIESLDAETLKAQSSRFAGLRPVQGGKESPSQQ